MKVLIVQPWIDYRGAEATCVYLAYYLKKLGHQAKICCLFVSRENLPHLADKVEITPLPSFLSNLCQRSRVFLFLFGSPLLFLKTLLANDVDVLNPHNLPAYWVSAMVGRIRKIPVVWTAHTLSNKMPLAECRDLIDYFTWLAGSSFLDKFFVKRIDRIIVSGDFLKKLVKKRYGRRAVVVTPGINLEIFKLCSPFRVRKKYHLEGQKVLLNVGTLRADKNQGLLLDVLKILLEKYPQLVLMICGGGPEAESLENKAKKLGLEKKVIFAGFIEPRELSYYYAACDLYLLPSRLETWGLTAFEALSQKRVPLVAPGVGSAVVLKKERIGLIVEPKTEALVGMIKSAFKEKKQIREMGERGYNFVNQKLSWPKYASSSVKIFKEVLRKSF